MRKLFENTTIALILLGTLANVVMGGHVRPNKLS